jgi:hypothetical protein
VAPVTPLQFNVKPVEVIPVTESPVGFAGTVRTLSTFEFVDCQAAFTARKRTPYETPALSPVIPNEVTLPVR